MRDQLLKTVRQVRRVMRVRKRIRGTAVRPRLAVYRSHRNIYAQIIDDDAGRTLCAVGTASRELRGQTPRGGTVAAAAVVGKVLAEKALAIGIQQVCFDRRGRRYHGRIKALAEAARAAGLKF